MATLNKMPALKKKLAKQAKAKAKQKLIRGSFDGWATIWQEQVWAYSELKESLSEDKSIGERVVPVRITVQEVKK